PLYVFLSERYGEHRAIHSFPTRRSSDLIQRDDVAADRRIARDAILLEAVHDRGPRIAGRCGRDFGRHVGRLEQLVELGVRAAALDRKSTRLNSSHVKISYAVFCLKKKR